jgi:hypothetical protein
MENAGLYSVPDEPPPILVSGFGPWRSGPSSRSGPVERYRAGGASGPTIAALKVCWDTDEARARKQAHALWWPTDRLPGQLNQELPMPAHFEQAASLVTEDLVAEQMSTAAVSQSLGQ